MSHQKTDTPFLLGRPIDFPLHKMTDEQIQSYLEYADLAIEFFSDADDTRPNNISEWRQFKIAALSELEKRYLFS